MLEDLRLDVGAEIVAESLERDEQVVGRLGNADVLLSLSTHAHNQNVGNIEAADINIADD
jgi:hypothetical protein